MGKIAGKEEIMALCERFGLAEHIHKNYGKYSLGMKQKMRLIQAFMEKPDILIVDEVLAVGDFRFQEKCKQRMAEMMSGGTTMLFVSHSAEQVRELCQKAVWLEKGRVKMIGDVNEVCDCYEAG